uniref:Uncharacterized protein n=1 Tax=Amphimedon queenslandica TaxID=400682 RepID=A0A1X7UM08_AMPQE
RESGHKGRKREKGGQIERDDFYRHKYKVSYKDKI